MKLVEIRLPQEADKSFIFYHENLPFAGWHNHPEYELVLITKGWGKRSVGDHIDRFEPGELILMGPYLPHEYVCDEECLQYPHDLQSECIVIQFDRSFLGDHFFQVPENKPLLKILSDSIYGCKFGLEISGKIAGIMTSMPGMNDTERLYALFNIFGILTGANDYEKLSSPQFAESFLSEENVVMKRVIQYLMQNFQQVIRINEVLEMVHMSNSSFYNLFRKTYRMTFMDYLLKIRIGYACRLMLENNKTITEIAYHAGFENLSNFNRQFKKIKKLTPTEYIALRKKGLKKA